MDLAKYYPSDKYDKDERHFTIFQLKGLQWKQPEQHLDKNHVSTGHHETLNFVTSQKIHFREGDRNFFFIALKIVEIS